jgi:voltage-gated potassium channel
MPILRTLLVRRGFRSKFRKARASQFFAAGAAAVLLLAICAVLFGIIERSRNENIRGFGIISGFEWVTRTLLEGASPWDITTGIGKFLNYVVLIGGVGLAATVTGALAAKLFDIVMKRGSGMGDARESDHIVICGWSAKGEEILRELHAEEVQDKRPVVILVDLERSPTRDELTTWIRGNPTSGEDLLRAGVDRADTAIILADQTAAGTEDADAKTLLTTLAVESINPNCYTCVEVIKSENRQHFERTKADELVVSAELTGALLASSAITHGLSRVVTDLITHPVGNEFYEMTAPEDVVGKTFGAAVSHLKESHDCIAMAVSKNGSDYEINPPRDRTIGEADRLLVIAQTGFTGDRLSH